jgi:N,N'-diacetyllegionaminate synthase
MRIGGHDIAARVLVVAEIGNNHEGDLQVARELVRQASESGAHAVKFQVFRTERYVSGSQEARVAQLRRFELRYEDFAGLAELARSLGLLVLATPLDLESAAFVAGIVDGVKVASGDNDFYPLLRQLAAGDKPLVVSTGLSDLDQVGRAVRTIEDVRGARSARLALLHCVTAYPAQPAELNLRAIPLLAERFGYPIGYSDHTLGVQAAVLAVAAGARIVEKHFTLENVESDFRDHALSARPAEMRELVELVAAAEAMLGRPEKAVQPGEEPNVGVVRRSVAAAADLEAGHALEVSDLMWVRPAGGLPPGEEERLLGGRLTRSVAAGELLAEADVER